MLLDRSETRRIALRKSSLVSSRTNFNVHIQHSFIVHVYVFHVHVSIVELLTHCNADRLKPLTPPTSAHKAPLSSCQLACGTLRNTRS